MTIHVPPAMAACYLDGAGRLDLRERAVPRPADNQVLIQVTSVGICGSDLHFFRHGRVGIEVIREPLILGHECAGVIVGTGAKVDARRPGERVSIEPQKPCRACPECRRGDYNLCQTVEFFGAPPVHGAMTEYVVLDADFAHPVGAAMSDDAAALIEPLSIGLSAIRKARLRGGETVLIAGAGPIGVLTAQTALALGAGRVTITDPFEGRRRMALERGVAEALDPTDLAPERRFDVFVDCSGHEGAVLSGMAALAPGGIAVLVGVGADRIATDPDLIRRRELTVTGIFRSANIWPDCIALVERGAIDLDSMVSRRFPLSEVEQAFAAAGGADVMKVVIDMRRPN